MNDISQALQWRYATKQYDTTKKVSDEHVQKILEAIQYAPNSFGLQAWRAIIVHDVETRKKLREVGYNQAQITDASHLIVFAVKNDITEADTEEFMQDIVKERGVERSTLDGYAQTINGALTQKGKEGAHNWMSRQAYISLGFGLLTAALLGVDACPMEGFDNAKFDEILGLTEKGLSSKAILTLGYRVPSDPFAHMKKVRTPQERLFIQK